MTLDANIKCVVEDKLSTKTLKRKRSDGENETSGGSDSETTSDSEEEDDAGELATEALDSEILATLNAIRSKDPRVYDKKTTFYTQLDDDRNGESEQSTTKKEKPMFLRDYHRENLLNGIKDDSQEIQETPMTYNQEQEALKKSIVSEIHAAKATNTSSDDESDSGNGDDEFLVAKQKPEQTSEKRQLDVENADEDPETFLSNFMAVRAWIPSERSQIQPFESDDEEEDRKAEEFEEAYNFRFEDPAKSNEKLISHARDIAAKYSVRREDKKARKKQREAEREKKEAAKRERAEEKGRLRKLKIEEAEEKLLKIKKAAGLKSSSGLSQEDWARFLDDDWDDTKWEEEMQKRFGEAYYAQEDASSDDGAGDTVKKRKPKKPKWDDDIEIKDIIPDFEEGDRAFELSDVGIGEEEAGLSEEVNGHGKSAKDHSKEMQDKKKEARKERRIIEQLVDERLELDTALAGSENNAGGFRYRETSPLSFGLSARDILMADDSQLNEYAGLKKLASFRDPNKKGKDQKRLGKKARLRQWRRDTFGNEEGPTLPEQVAAGADEEGHDAKGAKGVEVDTDIRGDQPKKKRRRTKKHKGDQTVNE